MVETEDFGALPRELPWQKDGKIMVLIPAGPFTMGVDNPTAKGGKVQEGPAHKVWLASYYIDKFEVTNAEYEVFARATGRIRPRVTRARGLLEPDRPVVGVTWHDALAYAEWAGKLLPTEAQWEKAARGPEGFIYPWGNEWREKAANTRESQVKTSVRPGTFPLDKSPYGVFDMAGNASEGVFDWYDKNYYEKSPEKNPKGPAEGVISRVFRGGDYYNASSEARAINRRFRSPNQSLEESGFRCVRDLHIIPTPTPRPTFEFVEVTPTATPEPFAELEPELIEAWSAGKSLPITLTPLNVGARVGVSVANRLPVDVSISIISSEPMVALYDSPIAAFEVASISLNADLDMALYVKVPAIGRIFRMNPAFRSNSSPRIILEPGRLLPQLPEYDQPAVMPEKRPELTFLYDKPAFLWNHVFFFNDAETTVTLRFEKCPLDPTPRGARPEDAFLVDIPPKTIWESSLRPGNHKIEFFYLRTYECGAKPLTISVDNRRDSRAVILKENHNTNQRVRVFTRMLPYIETQLLEANLANRVQK